MSDTNGGQAVTLGGLTVPLVLPPSVSVRLDVYWAGGTNLDRAVCAALGVCWGDRSTRPRPTMRSAKYDARAYGGLVLDHLLERGFSYREILQAGGEAFGVIEASVADYVRTATHGEVEETEDFSGVPAAAGSG